MNLIKKKGWKLKKNAKKKIKSTFFIVDINSEEDVWTQIF